jgi:MFS family permease
MIEAPAPEANGGTSWRESAVEFVSARMELLALESRLAAREAGRRGALLAIIAGCGMTAWLTAIAGLIGWVATAGDGIAWHWVALAAAVLHLILAGIAVMALRRPAPPVFPLVRAELSKDREWILNLKDKPQP